MPETTRCSRCKQDKPLDHFAWKNKSKKTRQVWCRLCRKVYHREHYQQHRALYTERARERNRRIKLERTEALLEYLAAHPCADCGEPDPVVLDFDHLRDKAFDISAAYTTRRWAVVLEEIEKCEVVCSNCHRRRTAQRIGTLKLTLLDQIEAGDENRTRTESLEGSRAAVTPRPQGGP